MIYAIINISDLSNIDFNEIGETNENSIRKSIDKSKFVIKYNIEPSFIKDGSVIPIEQLSHQDCLELMQTSEWSEPMPE
tara:strand:- start:33 stop:269 length:237 start_codon:yes stop_codon:yes gene_type:complete